MDRFFTLICMTLIIQSVSCCNSVTDRDPVLSEFAVTVELNPSDSVNLENFGILMPESVSKYGYRFMMAGSMYMI